MRDLNTSLNGQSSKKVGHAGFKFVLLLFHTSSIKLKNIKYSVFLVHSLAYKVSVHVLIGNNV